MERHQSAGSGSDREDGVYGALTLFQKGDGQDVIRDYDHGNKGNEDRIILGAGMVRESLAITSDGDDIVLIFTDPDSFEGNNIRLENAYTDPSYRIEEIQFQDGSVLTSDEMRRQAAERHGTDATDTLLGSSGDDFFFGHGGNDTLKGFDGNDELHGGAGNDILTAQRGNNYLYGGDGVDQLLIDRSYSADQSQQVNVMEGGRGNDMLQGFTGAEHYIFNRGDGQDVISDLNEYSTGIQADRIELGEEIYAEHISVGRSGGDIVLSIIDPEGIELDQITIESAFTDERYVIEELAFHDGTVWSHEYLVSLASTMYGTSGDDMLTGSDGNDSVFAGAGNDTIAGGHGDDQLYGEEGNDTITASYGNNHLEGGAGDDHLSIKQFGYATQKYLSHTLIGGTGNDLLEGYVSADTYVFNPGDGHDIIIENNRYNYDTTDRIQFNVLGLDDLAFAREADDLLISTNSENDSVRVQDWYVSSESQIEEILVAGVTLTNDMVASLV